MAGSSVQSQLQPQIVERWVADDGSTRVKTTRNGETDVVSHGPTRNPPPATRLSANPALLQHQLLGYPDIGQDNPGIPNRVERTERAVDALRDYGNVPPALQAALWRVLADQHLVNRGEIVDRAGRHGIAFTLDTAYSGLPTRYVLIIDPQTGRLLSFKGVLTKSAGKLNVKIQASSSTRSS